MILDSLQTFLDLVDTGSFSRAAERNFVSQSAVSQRLQALEREYGQTLLDRGQGRGRVTATAAGEALYRGAREVLQRAAALDDEMRQLSDEVAGTVRVATVYSVGLHALPPRLKPFLAAHPRVNVHLEYEQTDKVYDDVASGRLDVGIVACPSAKRDMEVLPFAEEEMVVICAPEHPLARERQVGLRQLDGLAFIGFADDIPTRRLVDDKLQGGGGARPNGDDVRQHRDHQEPGGDRQRGQHPTHRHRASGGAPGDAGRPAAPAHRRLCAPDGPIAEENKGASRRRPGFCGGNDAGQDVKSRGDGVHWGIDRRQGGA